MQLSDRPELAGPVAAVLRSIQAKGVSLWSQGGQLRYRAPKGALGSEEIELLRSAKNQIAQLLEVSADRPAGTTVELARRPHRDHAPLAFSQWAHWRLYDLSQRASLCVSASAFQLRGELQMDAFRKAVAEIVRRHDALRTQIIIRDGVPRQEIAIDGIPEIAVDDLTALGERAQALEVRRRIEMLVLHPIDLATDALFRIRLLKLRCDEHVLIVIFEHIITDATSKSLFIQELLQAYDQASTGCAFELPEIAVQFADYAYWQNHNLELWLRQHGPYWETRLSGSRRLAFPETSVSSSSVALGFSSVPIRIENDLKRELQAWCNAHRTTLALGVFTVFAALVLRWCHTADGVFRYQVDGRATPALQNAIGYFASKLLLRVQIEPRDRFADVLERVMAEYCAAYEHFDFSYLESGAQPLEVAAGSLFNWVPRKLKSNAADRSRPRGAIEAIPVPFDYLGLRYLDLDWDPSILLYDTDEEIVGGVEFPLSRFSTASMEHFARNFLTWLRAIPRKPELRVHDLPIM
jgi:hypothetical protein